MIALDEIDSITRLVEQNGLSEATVVALRQQFPGKHFTYCLDDDTGAAKPVVERAKFAIYLVNSSDHCSVLTNDPDTASGVVLAEIID